MQFTDKMQLSLSKWADIISLNTSVTSSMFVVVSVAVSSCYAVFELACGRGSRSMDFRRGCLF